LSAARDDAAAAALRCEEQWHARLETALREHEDLAEDKARRLSESLRSQQLAMLEELEAELVRTHGDAEAALATEYESRMEQQQQRHEHELASVRGELASVREASERDCGALRVLLEEKERELDVYAETQRQMHLEAVGTAQTRRQLDLAQAKNRDLEQRLSQLTSRLLRSEELAKTPLSPPRARYMPVQRQPVSPGSPLASPSASFAHALEQALAESPAGGAGADGGEARRVLEERRRRAREVMRGLDEDLRRTGR
jgi:chromosome segregation ATPase